MVHSPYPHRFYMEDLLVEKAKRTNIPTKSWTLRDREIPEPRETGEQKL